MKHCHNCQSEIKENAKFCTNCGANLIQSEEPLIESENDGAEVYTNEEVTTQTTNSVTIDTEKLTSTLQNYWDYFKRTLISPSISFAETDDINGLIQFTVIALLNAFIQLFLVFSWYPEGKFSFFFSILLSSLAFNFMILLIVFGLKRILLKSELSFQVIASQFGGFLSTAIVLQVVLALFSLIAPIGLIVPSTILSLVVSAIFIAGFNIYLYSSSGNAKRDRYFVNIIGNAIVIIFLLIVLRLMTNYMLNNLDNLINEILFELFYNY